MTFQEFHTTFRAALASVHLQCRSEKALQETLHQVLIGFPGVVRENHLTAKDIPDFTVTADGGGIFAVEVKVAGAAPTAILRQVKRYNALDVVRGTVLVCIRPIRMPEMLSGKPVAQINLYRNML